MLAIIPFAGFYCSHHDADLDQALEMVCSDDSGNVNADLLNAAFDAVDWRSVHESYAQHYCAAFLSRFGIVGVFESMHSPREYNFATDRIFAELPADQMARMLAAVPRDLLDKIAADWFTSRSGFISSYSPDVDDWGDVATWDHNQCGALLAAYVAHLSEGAGRDFDSYAETDLMESARDNGRFDEWLFQAPKAARVANIADYLRLRQQRGYTRRG